MIGKREDIRPALIGRREDITMPGMVCPFDDGKKVPGMEPENGWTTLRGETRTLIYRLAIQSLKANPKKSRPVAPMPSAASTRKRAKKAVKRSPARLSAFR